MARLTGEFLALAVPANSPFRTAKDFADALKADPTKCRGRRRRPEAPTTSSSA